MTIKRPAAVGLGDHEVSVSIIVPAHNSARELRQCLSVLAGAPPDSEVIVVDDASTDGTAAVAAEHGVRLLQLEENSGPAAARNFGARHARGAILFFLDADVILAPGAIDRVIQFFTARPDIAAVFGSYDAEPAASGIVSQYRNLLHHFVHQTANPEASTFWAGCGAIRRPVFERVAGFDVHRFRRPSIEDIELGYRLRRAGYRIFLDKGLQVRHLKKWTLRSVILTDIAHRAIPWSRLILESRNAPNDLNLTGPQRLSAALVGLAGVSLLLAPLRFELALLSLAALAGVLTLNRRLYAFFLQQRGTLFAALCIPLHLLYFVYSGLCYQLVWLSVQLRASSVRLRRATRLRPR